MPEPLPSRVEFIDPQAGNFRDRFLSGQPNHDSSNSRLSLWLLMLPPFCLAFACFSCGHRFFSALSSALHPHPATVCLVLSNTEYERGHRAAQERGSNTETQRQRPHLAISCCWPANPANGFARFGCLPELWYW